MKQKSSLLGYVMILFIVFLSYKLYKDSDLFQLTCVVSDVDGNKYCVREERKFKRQVTFLPTRL